MEIKEELLLEITKLQTQTKATIIELEDLRNRTMRYTLIFKNTSGIQNELWEDTSRLLADFITFELDLPYSFEEIDLQISRAHRSTEHDKDYSSKCSDVQIKVEFSAIFRYNRKASRGK